MARTLTAGTIAQSTQRLGSEPIVIVAVEWTSGVKYYGDKSFVLGTLTVEGRIIDFGTVSSQVNDRTYGTVESASVTLTDVDGVLKIIFDSEIIEKVPVTIYHHFEGLDESDLTKILVGKVMSPIVWNEGERKLSFEIGNDWNSEDVLLEIKEPSVDFPSEEDIGTVFPLCFGTVLRLPGVRVNRNKTGKLLTPIFSWTTWYRINDDPTTSKFTWKQDTFKISGFEGCIGQFFTLEIGGCLFYGSFTDDTTFVCESLGQFNTSWHTGITIASRDDLDADYTNPACAWVSGVGAYNLENKFVKIRFNAEYYYITCTDELGNPVQDLVDTDAYSSLLDAIDGGTVGVDKQTQTETFVAQISSVDTYNNKIYFSRDCVDGFNRKVLLGGAFNQSTGNGAQIQQVRGQVEYEWEQLPTAGTAFRWDIGPGAEVRVYDPTRPDLYVFNSVESEEIFEVACKNNGMLYLLPENTYVITLANNLNVNGNIETLTTIHLVRDLAKEGWDTGTIYASLRSTIHSNTATDVIDWIITNRTDLIPNASNFTTIGALIEKYPSHFALLSQQDALEAIQAIAWLARLGVFIDADEMFLYYLAKQPTSYVFEAVDTNIRFKSMAITKTSSDDIYTKFTSFWNFTYEEEVKRKIKGENNVDIYGEEKFEIENYIYNIESLVQKCHDFWLNRKSNCWYTIEINTFLTSLNVQIWDAVRINVTFINGGTPIIGHVIGIGHDSSTHQIVLTVWLPLKHGNGDAYQDDSGDVKPDDPGSMLEPLDYAFIEGRPASTVVPDLFKRARMRRENMPASDLQAGMEPFLAALELLTFQAKIMEIYKDCLKCKLIDPIGFTSEVKEYFIKNNLMEEDNTLYVAMPIAIRETSWKDEEKNTVLSYMDDNGITHYKKGTVKYERWGDSGNGQDLQCRVAKPQSMPDDFKDDYQMITPSYMALNAPEYWKAESEVAAVIIDIQYKPRGTGLVTKNIGKIVWQDVTTREWASLPTADGSEPQSDD